MKPTTIAYYLGQFHPLEENNQFWGDGFSEWHNVAKARPLYPGHAQPVLPGSLGFYDLRCDETLIAQLDYARQIGVDALCHWHYWFAGRRLLHKPFERMLALPPNGVRLMLGWANESWTGIWHGLANRTIVEQTYNPDEQTEHARLIATMIQSERYLKLGDRSPFLIYKPRLIPDAKNYLDDFRNKVREFSGGEKLYIIGCWGPGGSEQVSEPARYGLDAVVINNVGRYFESSRTRKAHVAAWIAARRLGLGPEIRSYRDTITTLKAGFKAVAGVRHATIVTGWDNTPRSGRRGLVLKDYNKDSFSQALHVALELERDNAQPCLFVKSWNEWAEGNVIEPRFHEAWSPGGVLKDVLDACHE